MRDKARLDRLKIRTGRSDRDPRVVWALRVREAQVELDDEDALPSDPHVPAPHSDDGKAKGHHSTAGSSMTKAEPPAAAACAAHAPTSTRPGSCPSSTAKSSTRTAPASGHRRDRRGTLTTRNPFADDAAAGTTTRGSVVTSSLTAAARRVRSRPARVCGSCVVRPENGLWRLPRYNAVRAPFPAQGAGDLLLPEPPGVPVRTPGPESGRQDLNLRPPGPQPGALPDCATPRYVARPL